MATKQDVIDVVSARASMFSTLAGLYFDRMSEEQIRFMANQDYTELMASENPLIASGFNDIYRYLRKRNTGTRQELAVDFSSCFLGTHSYKGFVAQPYESLFLDASGQLNAEPRKSVYRLYRQENVALRSGYDYPEDHLAFECEFMMILCNRSVEAVQADNCEEALRLLRVQESFMAEHINAWFQRLHDLSLKFIKTRFYRGVLNITQGFFDEEPDTIAELIGVVEEGFDEEPEADSGVAEADGAAEGAAEECASEQDAGAEGQAAAAGGPAGAEARGGAEGAPETA